MVDREEGLLKNIKKFSKNNFFQTKKIHPMYIYMFVGLDYCFGICMHVAHPMGFMSQ